MNKPLRIILIFFSVLLILSIYSLLHVVIGIYINQTLDVSIAWPLWILGVSSILCLILGRWKRNTFTTAYYIIGTTWMGVLFLAGMIIAPVLIINAALNTKLYPEIVLPITLILIAFALYNGRATRLKIVKISLKQLKKPLKIVQLTDIHVGEIYGPRFLKQIVEKTNSQKPDLVVITGDLFDGGGQLYDGMVKELEKIKCVAYFITGNHEVYEGAKKTKEIVSNLGITVLDDELITIKGLQLAGLSYQEIFTDDKRDILRKLAKQRNKKLPCVLLRHEPKDVSYASGLGFDMMLSGHTHNGQLWPLSYLVSLVYEFRIGLRVVGEMILYISPGVSTWGPAMRLGSRSEITVFELSSKYRVVT